VDWSTWRGAIAGGGSPPQPPTTSGSAPQAPKRGLSRRPSWQQFFLAERYHNVRLMTWAVRLSSVTLLHSRQKLELFGNIFTWPIIAQGLGQFLLFLAKIRRGSIRSWDRNTRNMKIWRFRPISRFPSTSSSAVAKGPRDASCFVNSSLQ